MFGSPETTTGGKALKFYASVRLDVRRIETLKDGSEAIGNRTRVKVVKNKVAPPFKQAEFDIIYGQGISREGGLIDMGVEQGFVRKSGAWYTYEGDQLGQGKENARAFLRDNPDLADELEKKIKEKLGIGPRLTRRSSTSRSTSELAQPARPLTADARAATAGHRPRRRRPSRRRARTTWRGRSCCAASPWARTRDQLATSLARRGSPVRWPTPSSTGSPRSVSSTTPRSPGTGCVPAPLQGAGPTRPGGRAPPQGRRREVAAHRGEGGGRRRNGSPPRRWWPDGCPRAGGCPTEAGSPARGMLARKGYGPGLARRRRPGRAGAEGEGRRSPSADAPAAGRRPQVRRPAASLGLDDRPDAVHGPSWRRWTGCASRLSA